MQILQNRCAKQQVLLSLLCIMLFSPFTVHCSHYSYSIVHYPGVLNTNIKTSLIGTRLAYETKADIVCHFRKRRRFFHQRLGSHIRLSMRPKSLMCADHRMLKLSQFIQIQKKINYFVNSKQMKKKSWEHLDLCNPNKCSRRMKINNHTFQMVAVYAAWIHVIYDTIRWKKKNRSRQE